MFLFEDEAAWDAWLSDHFTTPGVWLKIARKTARQPSVSYQQALDVALCYRWIDTQTKSLDAKYYMQKFTPHGPKSVWSKIKRARVMQLIEQGRMKAPGFAAIETAKASGIWDAAYDPSNTIDIPADFQAALDEHPRAKAFFQTLNSQNRYAFLHRTQTAKKAETRQKRIEQFIQMLERGEKLYP